jgi:hypothetical protein
MTTFCVIKNKTKVTGILSLFSNKNPKTILLHHFFKKKKNRPSCPPFRFLLLTAVPLVLSFFFFFFFIFFFIVFSFFLVFLLSIFAVPQALRLSVFAAGAVYAAVRQPWLASRVAAENAGAAEAQREALEAQRLLGNSAGGGGAHGHH